MSHFHCRNINYIIHKLNCQLQGYQQNRYHYNGDRGEHQKEPPTAQNQAEGGEQRHSGCERLRR